MTNEELIAEKQREIDKIREEIKALKGETVAGFIGKRANNFVDTFGQIEARDYQSDADKAIINLSQCIDLGSTMVDGGSHIRKKLQKAMSVEERMRAGKFCAKVIDLYNEYLKEVFNGEG